VRFLENRIPPPIVGLGFALLMAACTGLFGMLSVQFAGQRIVAAAILLVGLSVILVAIIQFRQARTTVNPLRPEKATALVSGGIFGLSRNPMYLGMMLALLAWATFLGNALALLLVWGFVGWINRLQIAPEERALRTHFGAEFEAYAAKVRRWI
jgi:protein-S-isoprenylcysteine O-methyltransferase Ste14